MTKTVTGNGAIIALPMMAGAVLTALPTLRRHKDDSRIDVNGGRPHIAGPVCTQVGLDAQENRMKKLNNMLEEEPLRPASGPAFYGLQRRFPIASLIPAISAAAVVLTLASAVKADVISTSEETLMQATSDELSLLSIVVGPDPSLNIQYNYAVDPSSGSFSYSTLPGQMYDGLLFSVSGAGTYDPTTATYDWTASGQVGSNSLADVGEAVWSGDPNAVVTGQVTIGGVTYSVSGSVNLNTVTGGLVKNTSSGSVTFTNINTGKSTQPLNVSDVINVDNSASITTTNSNPQYQFTGTFNGATKGHYYIVVPEPSSALLLLAGLGVVGLLGYAGRRAKGSGGGRPR
jgi:hypothetical protein